MRRRGGDRRQLATVLFTDIVGSTERAAALGDRAWRQLLERHHRVVRRILRAHGGREVDTAGDGFFATFGGPGDAIECAISMMDALAALDITIRAGIHTGEVEPMGAKVGGIAVHLGARIMGVATAGQILTSSTVRDLAGGGSFRFVDRGTHTLKGVDEAWHLFEVERPPTRAPIAEEAPPVHPGVGRHLRRWLIAGAAVLVTIVVVVVALWRPWVSPIVAASGPNVVRSIALDGSLQAGFEVGRGPGPVAVTDEAVWVGNVDGSTVSRLDRETGQDAVIGVGSPIDLAVANGLVWVLDPFSGTVTIIQPGDAAVVGTIDVHGRAMAGDADGLWLADDITDSVHRIDPRTRTVVGTVELTPEAGPSAIAVFDQGAWTANSLARTVSRIDTGTMRVAVAAVAMPAPPTAIAAAASGVWVVAESADVLYRIDPASNRVASQQPICDAPTRVVATAASVWVACGGDRVVWRIDVTGGDPVVTELDGAPGALAIDGDRVWVTIREP